MEDKDEVMVVKVSKLLPVSPELGRTRRERSASNKKHLDDASTEKKRLN